MFVCYPKKSLKKI